MDAEMRHARWLVAGLGLFDLAMLAWFLALMMRYGTTFVFPQAAVSVIVILHKRRPLFASNSRS